MPKIDPTTAPLRTGSRYPAPFDEPCRAQSAVCLADAAGLTQFGVNLLTLPPGAWSSQRHWHSHEDELAYVLSGEVVLVEDEGEQTLVAGDSVGWKAGTRNGHTLQNRTDAPATLLVVGTRHPEDHGEYPDIDLTFLPGRYTGGGGYAHKDGRRY